MFARIDSGGGTMYYEEITPMANGDWCCNWLRSQALVTLAHKPSLSCRSRSGFLATCCGTGAFQHSSQYTSNPVVIVLDASLIPYARGIYR